VGPGPPSPDIRTPDNQAIDRTAPACRTPARRSHDYVRNGTTSLFAGLHVATGQVIASHHRQHWHQEFLKFLKTIDAATPAGQDLHLICDNYATRKTPQSGQPDVDHDLNDLVTASDACQHAPRAAVERSGNRHGRRHCGCRLDRRRWARSTVGAATTGARATGSVGAGAAGAAQGQPAQQRHQTRPRRASISTALHRGCDPR